MKRSTRVAILSFALATCGGGFVLAYRSSESVADFDRSSSDYLASNYEHVAAGPGDLAFNQLESIILHDKTAIQHHGTIEFGSVKVEGAAASVEVFYLDPDGRMTPFLYNLIAIKDSWKIYSVQRIWFVPRSHLLRGLRV